MYNVTTYLSDHPGGADVLLQYSGKDASSIFESVGHSDDARARLETLLIGDIDEDGQVEEEEVYHKVYPDTQNPDRSSAGPLVYSVAGIGLAGLAFAGRRTNWGAVYSWITTSGGPHRQYVKGLLAAMILGAGPIGLVVVAALPYVAPSPEPQRFSSFRKSTSHFSGAQLALPERSLDKSPLDPKQFRSFPLIGREELPANSIRLRFGLPTNEMRLGLPVGQHVVLEADIDGKVLRSYTPSSSPNRTGSFDLVVKVYPGGKMGTYLSKLAVGSSISCRGPKGSMKYYKGWAKNILMIAGGSGITPMYQMLLAICEDEEDNTKTTLLFGNAKESDILLRAELDKLQKEHPDKLAVVYVIDKAENAWDGPVGHIDRDLIEKYSAKPGSSDAKVLLCGPPGMVKAITASLVNIGYNKPNPMSTMDDQIFVF